MSRLPTARRMHASAERLERPAARGDMRELVVRAALQRAPRRSQRLGSARLFSEAIDKPLLYFTLATAV